MTCYSIPNWNERFENNRSRIYKELSFVCVPNNHDGDGFCQLMDHHNGAALYGAWMLILQVASKCRPRGILIRDNGEPHTVQSIARKTRGDVKSFEEAIPVLLKIGWLVQDSYTKAPDSGSEEPDADTPAQDTRHRKKEEKEEKERKKENYTALVASATEPAIEAKAAEQPIRPEQEPKQATLVLDSTIAAKEQSVASMSLQIYESYRPGYKVKRPMCVAILVKRFAKCPTYAEKLAKFEDLLGLTAMYVNSPAGRSQFCSNSDTFFRSKIEEDDPDSWNTDRDDGPKPKPRPPREPDPHDTPVSAVFGSIAADLEQSHASQNSESPDAQYPPI